MYINNYISLGLAAVQDVEWLLDLNRRKDRTCCLCCMRLGPMIFHMDASLYKRTLAVGSRFLRY